MTGKGLTERPSVANQKLMGGLRSTRSTDTEAANWQGKVKRAIGHGIRGLGGHFCKKDWHRVDRADRSRGVEKI